ncbi:uncharacterized protein LOC123382533 isoform X2 [Felis catus]|nr:uncharacterized protein LOC123382533 isoform X2 [Felis catus]
MDCGVPRHHLIDAVDGLFRIQARLRDETLTEIQRNGSCIPLGREYMKCSSQDLLEERAGTQFLRPAGTRDGGVEFLLPVCGSLSGLALLQYVDDTLIAADKAKDCERGTQDLLATQGALGYRASTKKAQIHSERVLLRSPGPYMKLPKRGKHLNGLKKKKLPLIRYKRPSLSAPALGLPDITKPFHLFVDEHKGIAKGVLTQALGPWNRPVAYLSKKLDPVAAGWPPCLRIIAATALLVKDVDKLTLGQEIWITTPHTIEGVLKQPPDRWLSNTRMTHYQSLLLNPPRVRFHPSAALNPATLLPNPDLGAPLHDCVGILEQVHGFRTDLTDRPLRDAEATWFTDGSSFVRDGHRYAGAAVVTETDTVWAEDVPSRTSAQRAELVALTKALTLGARKRLNNYRPGETQFYQTSPNTPTRSYSGSRNSPWPRR